MKATHGCKKSSPSYQFNSLKFDSEKLLVTTPWDHLKQGIKIQRMQTSMIQRQELFTQNFTSFHFLTDRNLSPEGFLNSSNPLIPDMPCRGPNDKKVQPDS